MHVGKDFINICVVLQMWCVCFVGLWAKVLVHESGLLTVDSGTRQRFLSSFYSCCKKVYDATALWRVRNPLCSELLIWISSQPAFPVRMTLRRMWIIIVIDSVVSEWLATPGGGILEEGKEFAFLPPCLFNSLSHSLSHGHYILFALSLTPGSFSGVLQLPF